MPSPPRARSRSSLGPIAMAAVVFASTVDAHAQTAGICARASENAQRLKMEGKLVEAFDTFASCAREGCPRAIAEDCSFEMESVERALPSIVVKAHDETGRDLTDVSVAVDRTVVRTNLNGRAISVDPGQHVFRFERKGSAAVEREVLILEGEKNRVLEIAFERAPSAPAWRAPSTGPPAGAYVFAGLGLAALGAATVLALNASNRYYELRESCAPRCPESDSASGRRTALVADLVGGAGLLALGVSVYLFFFHPRASQPSSHSRCDVWRF